MKSRKTLLPIIFLIVLTLVWVLRQPLLGTLKWFGDRDAVITFVQEFGFWGPAILFILLILQVFLAFIPGQALMITCSYLYGFWGGMLITWTSLVAGGHIAFLLARLYGRPFAEHWVSPNTLSHWDKTALGRGIAFFAMSLVLPVFPNDAMCYVAGLGKISTRHFLYANMIGRGMACLLASIVGAYGSQIPLWGWVCGIGIIFAGCINWWAKKHNTPARNKNLEGDRHVCA
jgi:uncharacterized membrane protein YdjX (TVP38/TMEM64 family)